MTGPVVTLDDSNTAEVIQHTDSDTAVVQPPDAPGDAHAKSVTGDDGADAAAKPRSDLNRKFGGVH